MLCHFTTKVAQLNLCVFGGILLWPFSFPVESHFAPEVIKIRRASQGDPTLIQVSRMQVRKIFRPWKNSPAAGPAPTPTLLHPQLSPSNVTGRESEREIILDFP